MKLIKLSLFALLLSLSQISCNSNKEEAKLEPVTVEEGKTLIENSAIDMLGEVDNFKNDEALNELYDLAKELESKSYGKNQSAFLFNPFLNDVVMLKEGKTDITNLSKNQIQSNSNSLRDEYNESKGVYRWSYSDEDFVKTGPSENIEFIIDYTINGKSKTAKLIASNFSSEFLNRDLEVVNSLNVVFTIDGKELMTYSLNSEFDRYLPKSITSTYTLGSLKATENFSNSSNKELKNETEISINGKTLIKYFGSVTGDFNGLNSQGEDYELDEDDDIPLDKSSMALTIFDVKIAGDVDGKKLEDELRSLSDDASDEDVVKVINDNSSIIVSNGNKEIAKVEFFVSTYEETYYDYYSGEEYTETYEEVDARFVFNDDSTADFETYFGENFSTVERKFNRIIEEYTSKFDLD